MIFDFEGSGEVEAKSGLVLSSKWGKAGLARGNKTRIKDAKDTDISALEILTSVIRGGDLPKGFEAVQNVLENTSEIVQQYFDANGIAGDIKLKEGKIEVKYESENKYNVRYRKYDGTATRIRNNAPQANWTWQDTLVKEHDMEKVSDQKEKKFQKDAAKVRKGK